MQADSSSPAAAPTWETVAIVGVGLIGGSIGIDLLRRGLARQVVGIGRRAESLQRAREKGACTSTSLDLLGGLADAELVIVCTPVGRIVQDVLAAVSSARPQALVTDAGSTKGAIVAELDRQLPQAARYVGSHPLAGSEKAGPGAAVAGLFEGRTVVVTPSGKTAPADLMAISGFWQSLGARVTHMSPAEHDRLVAGASHLPHVIAAALAAATPQECMPLVASGWKDTTRIAAGDAQLWRDILLTNRGHVMDAMDRYVKALAIFRLSLTNDDAAKLVEVLEEAKRIRDAVGS